MVKQRNRLLKQVAVSVVGDFQDMTVQSPEQPCLISYLSCFAQDLGQKILCGLFQLELCSYDNPLKWKNECHLHNRTLTLGNVKIMNCNTIINSFDTSFNCE